MSHPVQGFLDHAPAPVLVLLDDEHPEAEALVPPVDGEVLRLSALPERVGRGWRSVLLVTADRASLRRLAGRLPRVGQTRVSAAWLYAADTPLVLVPRRDWVVSSLVARRADGRGVLTVARLDEPVGAHLVLGDLARQAVPEVRLLHGGVVVSDSYDPEADVPPDVVVADPGSVAEPAPHHVIDRAPLVVAPPVVEPVDEAVVNPVGWRKDWERPVADLDVLRLPGAAAGLLSETDIAGLRDLQGVRLDHAAVHPRLVVALAAAGVPILASGPPHPGLGDDLATALTAPADLDDPLAREQASVRVRRAALTTHSTRAWRAGLGDRAGVRHAGPPATSVLLATMRPQHLEQALRQLAAQTADVEVVVAAHGFAPDPGRVAELLGDTEHRLVLRDADVLFGDVLQAAFEAASGDVLVKVDDDDHYGPHAIADLLLARAYTGAEVVGMPSEFVHLEELDLTVRRNHPTEVFTRFVAGGTISIDRALLAAVGGFRSVRRFVDAQLLTAVETAGARIYRTHGLDYVLRRTASGHTWSSDPQSFRREEIREREWPGLYTPFEVPRG